MQHKIYNIKIKQFLLAWLHMQRIKINIKDDNAKTKHVYDKKI